MDKERKLYNKFIDTLIDSLDMDVVDPKVLNVILHFLDNNDIQAGENHKGLAELKDNILNSLPFDSNDDNEIDYIRVAPIKEDEN